VISSLPEVVIEVAATSIWVVAANETSLRVGGVRRRSSGEWRRTSFLPSLLSFFLPSLFNFYLIVTNFVIIREGSDSEAKLVFVIIQLIISGL
jgi:hypothetical protein